MSSSSSLLNAAKFHKQPTQAFFNHALLSIGTNNEIVEQD